MDTSPPPTRPESDTTSEASDGYRGASGSEGERTTERYLPIEMPERFALEVQDDEGDWILEAVCPADYLVPVSRDDRGE